MSERELVRLETIREIKPIEGADNIETAVVRGWNVVVGKGEFNVGDSVVFFEVDSFLPVTDERFAFLAPRGTKKIERDGQEVEGHVLRTAKLRGQVSQGLVLPASQFGDEILTRELFSVPLADTLGVFKYEPPIPANLAGQIVGKFPTQYARKTDSERVQNLVDVFEELRDNYDWIPTYKHDGSSVTIVKDENGVMRYCSRNWQLTPSDDLSSKVIAERYGIPDMMPNNSAIQAELVGPGIQGNRGGFSDLALKIFAYWENGEIAPPESRPLGLWNLWAEEVDVVDFEFPNSVEEAVQQVTGLKLPNGRLAEGVVWHTANGETVPYLDGRSTFKAINPSYLLKHGE